jgi:tRNA(Ile)-lysidine synthase
LLAHSRQELRNYLRGQGLDWIDDPSNQNTRYERVRMRQAGATLSELGLSTVALGQVAQNMAHVQEALDYHTQVSAREICQVDAGDVVLDMDRFVTLPQETARRLLLGAVAWVNGGTDHPRRHPTMIALSALAQGTPAQLSGCRIVKQRKWMRVCREHNAVRNLRAKPGELWDARWCLDGPDHDNVTVAALGETGLMQCPNWRETGRPHAALLAAPAAWRGAEVVAAPFAAAANGWTIQGPTSTEEFLATLLSH